ncbi:MAG: hybrid sensor histidine kinase/response regulator, partial [Thermoanaerobaculia bacterium]
MGGAVRTALSRLADYFGAQNARDRAKQERERALQRGIVGLTVATYWVLQYLSGREVQAHPWFVVFLGVALPAIAFGYRKFLLSYPDGGVAIQYAFLILDPVVIIGVLVQDPFTFAFLNPFMLVVIVRNGIRYGIRTMYLTWGVTLALCMLLLTSDFWRSELELTFAFLLMLALVPVFFTSLIRRIHSAPAIEEERARTLATHELAVARSAFLAKVSHELRSPLQGIVSALDVIEMRHARAFAGDEELIGRMRRSSMLLNTQLRDLLTLAKGEAGRLRIHAEPFEACALVEAMAEAARELAVSKGLQLRVVLPPAPLFAVTDGARIDQVLTNLVVNSIRYTDTGEVRVSMETRGDPPASLRFVVADTGPGIPEDVLPTLFEPDKFVTAPARRGEGSGIGLAIVRTLVDHLGGRLRVISELGKGTTFTVEIPAEFEAPGESDFADTNTHGRVLVVDDRSDVLDALESVIDELGYELDRAGSAAAATRLLSERAYDAVLLDLDMPVLGGAELLTEIRRGTGPNRESHFISISAAEPSSGPDPNFDLRLAKPIDSSALRRALLA